MKKNYCDSDGNCTANNNKHETSQLTCKHCNIEKIMYACPSFDMMSHDGNCTNAKAREEAGAE